MNQLIAKRQTVSIAVTERHVFLTVQQAKLVLMEHVKDVMSQLTANRQTVSVASLNLTLRFYVIPIVSIMEQLVSMETVNVIQ